jgi:putative flippase GtrA
MSHTLPRVGEGALQPRVDVGGDAAKVVRSLQIDGLDLVEPAAAVEVPATTSQTGTALVEVALPVYNEGKQLESSVLRLREFLSQSFPFSTAIRIIDNGSTDETWSIACRLAATHPEVSALHLNEAGKGRAIRAAWSSGSAEIVAYMDVDLSTGLGALLPLIAPLLSGHSDLAIGSRFAPGAHVLRGARRELVSRGYNLVLRAALRSRFSDATCGFKAMRRETADVLLPLVSDEHWFFDTELLVVAERNGYRIHEVPVDWIDDADSRLSIGNVAREDLSGVARLMRNRALGREGVARTDSMSHERQVGQTTRYAGVGLISTAAYLVVFFMLRHPLGTYGSNVVASALTTMGNTIAHARFTFGSGSGVRMGQAVRAGLVALVSGIVFTTLALGAESAIGATSALSEGVAILVGILLASTIRLVLLRASAYRVHTLTRT